MKHITLSYWQYLGNHWEGQDCPRSNQWGIPLDVIQSGHSHPSAKVKTTDKSSFGQEVHITLPVEVWQNLIDRYNAWVSTVQRKLVEAGCDPAKAPPPSPNLR